MSEKTRIVVDRCPRVMNRIPSAQRWRGLWTCLLIAAAMIAVPAARAAVTFPMYVSSFPNDSIVQVSPAGVVSPFATLPSGSGPEGLAFDHSGNLYAADFSTDQIIKIGPGGAVSLFATLPAGSGPTGLAIDGSGNLYAADVITSQISKINPGGAVSVFATLGSSPRGLAFDGSGNLYAAEATTLPFSTGLISKITPGGVVSFFATLPGTSPYFGLAFHDGNLYTAAVDFGQILKITSGGAVSVFATLPTEPLGLAFDGSGNLYAADLSFDGSGVNKISEITPDGLTVTTFATAINPPPPWYIAFAPVPEPASAGLLAIGSLALLRRRAPRSNVESAKCPPPNFPLPASMTIQHSLRR